MRPSLSGFALPCSGGTTIDTDPGTRVPPGSLSLARTSMRMGPWMGVGGTSSTATRTGADGGEVVVVVGGEGDTSGDAVDVVGADCWTGVVATTVPAGALVAVVVVSGVNAGAVVVVGSTFGAAGASLAVGPGAGAAACGGRLKLSPSTCVAGAAWKGRSPAARAATVAAPPTATLRAGWV